MPYIHTYIMYYIFTCGFSKTQLYLRDQLHACASHAAHASITY